MKQPPGGKAVDLISWRTWAPDSDDCVEVRLSNHRTAVSQPLFDTDGNFTHWILPHAPLRVLRDLTVIGWRPLTRH